MKDMEQREIKFRGKGISGEWVYGLLSISQGIDGQPEKGYYISNKAGMPWAYSVRPETVGQYTGLKDKNGKEIYDGDIIRRSTGYVFEVVLREYRLGEISQAKAFGHDWHESDEVIGTVFETPELISQQLT